MAGWLCLCFIPVTCTVVGFPFSTYRNTDFLPKQSFPLLSISVYTYMSSTNIEFLNSKHTKETFLNIEYIDNFKIHDFFI